MNPDGSVASIPFKLSEAVDYATKHCQGGNDCSSGWPFIWPGQYWDPWNTDCTHFICHCLKKGGVTIDIQPTCKSGLSIQVKALRQWLSSKAEKARNVNVIKSHGKARRGDIVILFSNSMPHHALMFANTPRENGAEIYGHQRERCGEFVPYSEHFDLTKVTTREIYRIDDYP